MTMDKNLTADAAPVTRRGFIVLTAGGIGGLLAGGLGTAGAAGAATPDPSPKLPNEYYRKTNQLTTTGVLYDDIAVRISGDPARMFIPQTIKPSSATPILVVWLFHGSGSDHNAIVGGFKSTAMAVVNAGGIAICQNDGGTIYSHPTAQALQVAGYSYLSSVYPIGANVLRATSGGGALAYETLGSGLIPNILGMFHVNSQYDLSAMYTAGGGQRDSIVAAFGDDPAAIAAANPARLGASAWAGKRARVIVSQPNGSDTTVPPAANGLQFLAVASATAAEASLRTHATGHSTPTFADTDFIATIARWRALTPDTTAPQVSITSPKTPTSATGSILVSAAAFDNTNVATAVFALGSAQFPARLNVDSILVPGYTGACSWIATLDTRLAPNGVQPLTVTVTDPSGNSVTSAPVAITVQNTDATPPSVSILSPADGVEIRGAVVPLRATAADDVAVSAVSFTVGTRVIAATLNAETGEWTASFDSTSTVDGAITVTATAVDPSGNTATSATVTPIVNNRDVQAPTVAIVSPASGSTIKGTVTTKASASDDRGVTGVAFYAGTRLIGNASLTADGLWTLTFNTKTSVTPNGVYIVTARATDAAGNVTVSAPSTYTIKN